MHLLALLVVLGSTLTKIQARCYKNGDDWGLDKNQANAALEEICSYLAFNYEDGQVKYFCINAESRNKKLEFWIENLSPRTRYLDKPRCKQNLGDEINGCSLGGESDWLAFTFRCVYASSSNRRRIECDGTN
jgi:hypothetical protein